MVKPDLDYLLIYTEDWYSNLSIRNNIKIFNRGLIIMRVLGILVILCVLFCTGCASKGLDYDAGIAAYKRADYKVALYDFEPRAMAGDPIAQFCLGFMYTRGQGVDKDPQEAIKWYEKAILQNYLPAHNNVLVGLIRSKVTADKAKVIELIQLVQWMAAHGNPVAQYNLGIIYSRGYGVPRDSKTAAEWYQKAADQGYARAQYELGLMYLEGRGVQKNSEEAYNLFKRTAEQRDLRAQYQLALMYYKGVGVEKNLKIARDWFIRAALPKTQEMPKVKGYSPAQYQLAAMYFNGDSVEKNLKMAVDLFKIAAGQHNYLAQHTLATMYNEGKGVPKNREIANRLFLESAQRGYAIAQADLGRVIGNQDTEEAYYWYSLADKTKDNLSFLDESSGENLIAEIALEHERLGKTLTEQQRNDIQKRVDNWSPRHLVSFGTGFYVSEKHILTNAHVVSVYDEIRVRHRPVRVMAQDKEIDLALLFDPLGKEDTAIFRSKPTLSGEDAFVFGYPLSNILSYDGNFTVGTISGLSGTINSPHPDNLFQYTAPTQKGNSGGPVLDSAGNVIGVVVSGLNPSSTQNINFAIKFDVVEDFLEKNHITDYDSTQNLGNRIDREKIGKKTRNFTVPVLCFKNIGREPLPLVEIDIDEQFKYVKPR